MIVLVKWLLISWVGTDDDATQSDPDFNNSGEGSELWVEEDAQSSTDGSMRPRRPTVERSERVIIEATPASASEPVPETLDNEFARWGLGSSKKSKKKSKISAASEFFEEN